MTLKKCSKCGEEKPVTEYKSNQRAKDKLMYSCIECGKKKMQEYHKRNKVSRNSKARERRKENPIPDQKYRANHRARFPWLVLIQATKRRSLATGRDFNLDQHVEDIKKRVLPMTCELTGIPLIDGKPGKRVYNTLSLDRIDSAKGYTYDNIRIVCWAINAAMGPWGEDVLRGIIKSWIEKEKT